MNHEFKNGDREEVEIRGCSIHVTNSFSHLIFPPFYTIHVLKAVELIREELGSHAINFNTETTFTLNSAMIDYFLWEFRRRFARELSSIPYHKVRCIYY